jgi:uncharacterized protein (TIRG00374 family)
MKKSFLYYLNTIFLVIGLIFFFFLLKKIDYKFLIANIFTITKAFFIIIIISFITNLIGTYAWSKTILNNNNKIPFLKLLKLKLIGDAFSYLIPILGIGGDTLRVEKSLKYLPKVSAFGSVFIDRSLNLFAQMIIILISLIVYFSFSKMHFIIKISLVILIIIILVLLFCIIFLQEKKLVSKLYNFLIKLNFIKKLNLKERIEKFDNYLLLFYKNSRKNFYKAFFCQLLVRFYGVLENLVVIFLLFNATLYEALIFNLVQALAAILFFFIPGQIGISETATGTTALLFKLTFSDGVFLQLMRRLRAIFWIIIGIILRFI